MLPPVLIYRAGLCRRPHPTCSCRWPRCGKLAAAVKLHLLQDFYFMTAAIEEALAITPEAKAAEVCCAQRTATWLAG